MKLNKFYKITMCLAIVIAVAFSATACNNDSGVEGIDMVATLSIDVGKTHTLQATLMPFGAEATITWKSSDESVATVSSNGVVTGVAAGKALVKASAGGKSATCTVTVVDPSQRSVPVTSVAFNIGVLTLDPTDTTTLTATVKPDNASDKTLTWNSSKPSVATVSQTGEINAIAAGKTVITATAHNNQKATCVVTVTGSGADDDETQLYVRKISALEGRDDFIMGMDASAVPSLEAAGVTYKNFNGQVEDVYKILHDNGITDIRIRIWNDPYAGADKTNGYGGGNCDVENAVAIATRCAAVGLGVIIDFHYSDFWADPGKQTVPKAWASYNETKMAEAISEFTEESLEAIKATGVNITMVQVGNETTGAICGASYSSSPAVFCSYINAGAAAVRKVTGTVANGGAKVAIHLTDPQSHTYTDYAKTFKDNNVDYDVFGTSYYPFWHGTLDALSTQLKNVHSTYGKDVMVLETSYAFTLEDFDGNGNTAVSTSADNRPFTVQGQANQILDVIETIAKLGDYGLGVCYWEGTWIAASTSDDAKTNRDLCKEYGCGWATSYAKNYDSSANDGGCVIDNQAFFTSDGTPLQSLKLFGLAKTGQIVDPVADYLYAAELFYTVNEADTTVTLPEKISVVLNDGSIIEAEPLWDVEASEVATWITIVADRYVTGTTIYGGLAECYIYVQNVNLLPNGGFEDDAAVDKDNTVTTPSNWKLTYTRTTNLQLYVSADNAKMGNRSFHFWDDVALNFDLYQEISASALASAVNEYGYGTFSFSIDFAGGDCGDTQNIYTYAKIYYNNGKSETIVKGSQTYATGWQQWSRSSVDVVIDSTVAKIEVGIHVTAEAGGWGNMDNAQFFFKSSSNDD